MLSQQWCFARSLWGRNTIESHGKQSWLVTRKGCQDPRTPHEGISTLQKAVWINLFRSTHLRKFYSLDPPPTPTGAGWGLGTSASTISSWYWSIRAHTATQSNLVMFTSAEFWGRYRILYNCWWDVWLPIRESFVSCFHSLYPAAEGPMPQKIQWKTSRRFFVWW